MRTYKQIITDYKAAKQAVKDSLLGSKEALTKHIQEILQGYPDVLGVSWTQGTPEFNDGDNCEFTVYPFPALLIRKKADDENTKYTKDDYIEELNLTLESRKKRFSEKEMDFLKPIFKSIGKELGAIPDDIFLEAFGDGQRVYINLQGEAELEDYGWW